MQQDEIRQRLIDGTIHVIARDKYLPLVEKIMDASKPHIDYLLDFAVKVFNSTVPNNKDTDEHVFRLIYFFGKAVF